MSHVFVLLTLNITVWCETLSFLELNDSWLNNGFFFFKGEMEKHLRLLVELAPEWLTLHPIRKDFYLKLNKNTNMSLVLEKLNQKIKEEERLWERADVRLVGMMCNSLRNLLFLIEECDSLQTLSVLECWSVREMFYNRIIVCANFFLWNENFRFVNACIKEVRVELLEPCTRCTAAGPRSLEQL